DGGRGRPARTRSRGDQVQLRRLPRADAPGLPGADARCLGDVAWRGGQGRGVKDSRPDAHYSYSMYADAKMARSFDQRRFGGPIGDLVARSQARVLANMVGRIQDRHILDVGTGTGRVALLLAHGAAKVTAVDASEEMLAIARKRAEAEFVKVRFERGDAHALDFPDRSFDAVVSFRLLMHAPEWRQCLAEMCRVSDRLVIIDYPSATSVAFFESWARRLAGAAGLKTEAYRVFTRATVAAALDAN